jgi:transposase InsO family protein
MYQISQSFHLRNMGRKVRKYVAHCDVCQRAKHPNRAYETERISHLPAEPGELLTLDLYGPLPTGRCGVKYLLVCLDVFSKHVTLYPLKAATTRSCLNKLRNHYFTKIMQPETILSDHGSQFASPSWRQTIAELGILTKYSPIRHPESNPTVRVMRELGKYFRIYCHETHKKWPELVPYIEDELNSSVS